ncbi:MAG: hypothetical protein J7L32_05350 [Thermoplasmata archaeon]|nr:hypothetical protein [Thermoplasmata archaeon]
MSKEYEVIKRRIDGVEKGDILIVTDEDNLINDEPFFGSWTLDEEVFESDDSVHLLVRPAATGGTLNDLEAYGIEIENDLEAIREAVSEAGEQPAGVTEVIEGVERADTVICSICEKPIAPYEPHCEEVVMREGKVIEVIASFHFNCDTIEESERVL